MSALPGVRGVRGTVVLESAVAVSAETAMTSSAAVLVRRAGLHAQYVHVGVTGSEVT